MKNILVPTDFSPEAHHALEVALQLARRTGGTVKLLHVLEELDEPSGGFSAQGSASRGLSIDEIFPIKLMEATRRRLLALLAECAPVAGDVPVQVAIKAGPIGEGILKAIEHYDIGLVVAGTRGRRTAEHAFVSSNTERMIRLAPCPVLTVKHRQLPYEVRTLVFPSDFTEEATHAIAPLREVLAHFPGARLHLLHVLGDRDPFAAQQRMRAFAERAQLTNVRLSEVNSGSTAAGIEQYAQQANADMVVIPTHARTGLSAFFHTSIAEAVSTHAFPPVLTFHLNIPESAVWDPAEVIAYH